MIDLYEIMKELSKQEEAVVWDQIKHIILITGRFDASEWYLYRGFPETVHTPVDTTQKEIITIKQKIMLMPVLKEEKEVDTNADNPET